MREEIKYRYALDANKHLVDVMTLDRSQVPSGTIFLSIDFEKELIPHLGSKRRKHFVHKHQHEALGSKETYLHALGKKVFRQEYELCLQSGQPFYLEYSIRKFCNRLKESYKMECELESTTEKFDLTKRFPLIREESRDESFIPDLLLCNQNGTEKIYIEIAVTHLSSEKKVASKNRIVEYHLSEEDDVNNIRQSKHGLNSSFASLINFRQKRETGNLCGDKCDHLQFYYFFVAKSGKAKLVDGMTEKTISEQRDQNKYFIIWDAVIPEDTFITRDYLILDSPDVFKYFLSKAYKNKVKVKNCFLCKYHAENNSTYFRAEGSPIFCKFLKIQCESNKAAGCEYYRVSSERVTQYIQRAKDAKSEFQ